MIQRIQWWKSLDISKLYEVVFAVTVGFPSLDWTIGFGVILNHWAMIKLLKIFQTTYCKFCDMVCFICWWLLYKIALSLALFTSCLYKILKLMTFVWGKFCACIGNELLFIFYLKLRQGSIFYCMHFVPLIYLNILWSMVVALCQL